MMGLLNLGLGCEPGVAPPVEGEHGTTVDSDGDGFPSWTTTNDPLLADCDDASAAVTPEQEVYVPGGPFTRGTLAVPHAEPVRTITLKPYCIDRTEVTNADFVVLLEQREASGQPNADDQDRDLYDIWDADDDFPQRLAKTEGRWSITAGYEDHPVVEVWEWSAEFYCGQLGKHVPTEAQWEKAARGDSDARSFPWGDEEPTCDKANFAPVFVDEPESEGPCVLDTSPVDELPAGRTPSGIAGLAGNASEWVSDWFDPSAYLSDDENDPSGPAVGATYDDGVGVYVARISRGGGLLSPAEWLHVSYRFPEPEDATSNGIGFRCARKLE